MQLWFLLIVLIVLSGFGYLLGHGRAVAARRQTRLDSLPRYYGYWVMLWCAVPALLVLILWTIAEDQVLISLMVTELPAHMRDMSTGEFNLLLNDIRNHIAGSRYADVKDVHSAAAAVKYLALQEISHNCLAFLVLLMSLASGFFAWRKIAPRLAARRNVEQAIKVFLFLCSGVAVLTTIGIVLSVLFEAIRFFEFVPVHEFLFGLEWSPQMAIREDQVGSSGAFGAVPLFAGTLLISAIAMVVAVPIGLMSAIYLAEYASPNVRAMGKPMLEVLAGIPTVVYGFFAALTVAPFIRSTGGLLGLDVASESALAAGLVMGIMIIPFISSLSDDVINAVPQSLRDGAYGLGATQSETIRQVVLPAALPGIVGGILLAVSRAIGETMIVVMAAGLAANLTGNPFHSVTTVTVQIVTLLVGDQEFDSPKTLAAFALGLVLFLVTLSLNVLALRVVRKYREQYD